MELGEFGDGVAEGVVYLALGAVAAVDVGEDFAGEVGGGGGGEGFDAVAGDEDDVGVELGEGGGEAGGGAAGLFSEGREIIAGGFPGNRGVDLEAFAADLVDGFAVGGIQVH